MILLRDFRAGSVSGRGRRIRFEEGVARLVWIRERRHQKTFESEVSVIPSHKTDMLDNHYKTSIGIK